MITGMAGWHRLAIVSSTERRIKKADLSRSRLRPTSCLPPTSLPVGWTCPQLSESCPWEKMSKHSKQVNHFNSALAPDGQMIMSFTGCYLCDEHIRQARHQDGHQLSASSRCPLFRVCWGLGIFGDVSVALCHHHVALVSVVLSFVRPQVTRYIHRVGRTV